MKADALLTRLGRGKPPAVTLLHGDEPWFADEAVRLIVHSFLGGEKEGLLTLDAPRGPSDVEGTPLGAALEEVRTAPMFAARKVVYFRSRAAPNPGEVDGLRAVAKADPAFSRMVLFVRSLGKGASAKLTRAGVAVGDARKLYEKPWPGQPEWKTALNQWVVGRARRRGKRMTQRNALALTQIVGNDLGALVAALTRLAASVGEQGAITEEDVRSLAGQEREFDAFAFGEGIYDRKVETALRVVRNSFLEGVADKEGRLHRDPQAVAGRLLWSAHFRLKDVYRAGVLLAGGKSGDEAVRALGGGKGPGALRAVRQAGGFSVAALRRHFVILAEAEAELRTKVAGEAVISRLVLDLIGAPDG